MENANFLAANKSKLKENYEKHLQDETFKKLVNSLNISDEILMKYTSKLQETCDELNNCKGCAGKAFCKNAIEGYVFYPKYENDLLHFNYVACKYEKEYQQKINNSANYIRMPENLKMAAMKDIYVKDKKRIPIIKYLKTFYDLYETDKHQKGLYLHGSFGSGKTYMICAMLNELAKKGVNVYVCYYPELLRSLKDSFNTGDFASRIDRLKNVPILFLDDIGAEALTPWARDEILGTILQHRMDANLPTFLTSNLNLEELEIHLSSTKEGIDKVKARRIIERIKYLTVDMSLVSKNLRETKNN